MSPFATTSSRWAALQSRDPAAANAFIYSVTTTKIYCRPTCPSRLARRANVVFHSSPSEAEADGFRPCKRCHPEVTANDGDSQKQAVAKACELLKKDGENGTKMPVKTLAAKVGFTECHFCRIFKKVMGVTVGEYRRHLESQTTANTSKVVMSSDFDQASVSNMSTPSDHLITPNEFDLMSAFNTITQAELDSLNNINYNMHFLESADPNYYGFETSQFCQQLPSEPLLIGPGEDIFGFVDFENPSSL